MIRRCDNHDLQSIWEIINNGAQAYKGIIPEDCRTDPYMPMKELQHEIDEGIVFWAYQESEALLAVMGIQAVQDVTLIRHAYVRTGNRHAGIGSLLRSHLRQLTEGPVLIGTWAAAVWAIRFYKKARLPSRRP